MRQSNPKVEHMLASLLVNKTPLFPWTMPQTENHPLFPCKCRLAYAPLLDWTAVAGI